MCGFFLSMSMHFFSIIWNSAFFLRLIRIQAFQVSFVKKNCLGINTYTISAVSDQRDKQNMDPDPGHKTSAESDPVINECGSRSMRQTERGSKSRSRRQNAVPGIKDKINYFPDPFTKLMRICITAGSSCGYASLLEVFVIRIPSWNCCTWASFLCGLVSGSCIWKKDW